MAEKRYDPNERERRALEIVKKGIEECRRWHEPFCRKVEKRYDAFRGMSAEEAKSGWRSNVTQPLLINLVEGMLATMEDGNVTWDVTGRTMPGMSAEEAMAQSDNADIAEALLQDQMRHDQFETKQSPFMQQDLIAGYTVGKVSWVRKKALHHYLEEKPDMVYDENGGTVGIADVIEEYEEDIFVFDGPSFEPRDVRDFMFPESATSVETAPYVIDRTFVSYKTLLKMQDLDIYENVEFLKETHHGQESEPSGTDVVKDREMRLRNASRTRGLIEVIEYWTDETVITIGNRSIVLRIARNPHWHGQKPFVTCSAIPDAFQLPGISVIEGLAQMQEMFWTLQNSRLDATRMASNLIKVIRADVENAGDFQWVPNANWFVRSVEDVKLLDIPTEVLRTTLEAEGLLKADIQGVMGGLPSTGGSGSNPVLDQNTATGISIVTNIAQAVLARRKQFHARTFGKVGGIFLSLDQQLLREERLVEIIGPGAAKRWIEVGPSMIRGFFDAAVRWEDDSMQRQEKRAESGVLLTNTMQFAAPAAQMGVYINVKKVWEKYLTSYGIANPQEYFLDGPPQSQLPVPGTGGATGPQAETILDQLGGGQSPGGVTNPQLAAGPQAVSNENSMSPAMPMQQQLAGSGGGRSA